LGDAYLGLGREEEAIKAHEKLAEVAPWWSSALGITYATTNHRDEAEHILNELENSEINGFIAVGLAHLNAALGNTDEVFKWLNYEPHHGFVAWAAVSPDYEPYHNDVRWKEFLERLNLPK